MRRRKKQSNKSTIIKENHSTADILDVRNDSLNITTDRITIYELLKDKNESRYERAFEIGLYNNWSKETKSSYIETLLLDSDLRTPFYCYRKQNGVKVFIDGYYRINAIIDFCSNDFELKNLKYFPSLNGKTYSDLPTYLQARIEDVVLDMKILRTTTPLNQLYALSNTVNSYNIHRSLQEIRHIILEGNSTKLLKELSRHRSLRVIIKEDISEKGMRIREIVLRYLTFKIYGYESYKEDFNNCLEKTMLYLNSCTSEELETIKSDFRKTMDLAVSTLGKKSFRIKEVDKDVSVLNIYAFETICYYLSFLNEEFVLENRNTFLNNYNKLLTNSLFLKSITNDIYRKEQTFKRFELVKSIMFNNLI